MNEETDAAIFREMGEAGLLGVTVPEEYGGVGAGYVLRPGGAEWSASIPAIAP